MDDILTACATRGSKPINQDACRSNARAVVVADGLGSFFQAEVASKFAADALIVKLQDASSTELANPCWYEQSFTDIQQALQASPLADLKLVPATHPVETAFGTTLLCAVAHADTLTIAYVGNGAIMHLRGGFNEFPDSVILPWNAVNYLNPHSVPQEGKNAMTRFIAPVSSGSQCIPTVLQLQQDGQGPGDILVVCSDGIHAADQVKIGRDSERTIWLSGDEALVILYRRLGEFLKQADRTPDRLQLTLERYLDELADAQLITDDCTVGVLISPAALAYYAPQPIATVEESLTIELAPTHGAG